MADAESLTSEFEDSGRAGRTWRSLDYSRLLEPNGLRRIVGIIIALMVVFWPARSEVILGRLLGIGLIGYGILTLWSLRRSRPVPWGTALWSLAAVIVGGLLAAFPAETEVALGRITGLVLIAVGVRNLVVAPRHRRHPEFGWMVTSACALIAIGALVVLFPSDLLATLAFGLAVAWIVVELLAISALLDPERDIETSRISTSELVAAWFAERPKTVEDRERLYRELLYEGDRSESKITRFVVLMVFASIIATMGVVADSTAVVVGAMLIAPLMMPLMGMALSLGMGWPNRLARMSLIAATGIVIAVGVGFVLGLADFTIVDTMTNAQIVSRSTPTTTDLVIAVAAGAAGAYGLSRPDVSNSLPGVAIAIALVPPLTVIGISYSQRDWASGNGALLLFATNAIAILVMGAAVFLLTGVVPLGRVTENQRRVRTAVAAIGGAAAVIIAALTLNGTSVATNVFEQNAAARAVGVWVEPFPGHTIVDVGVAGDNVSVVLAGPPLEETPSADELAQDLSETFGRAIAVDLRIRLETQELSGD